MPNTKLTLLRSQPARYTSPQDSKRAAGRLEYWNIGILGYGKMVKWVTCREPQGRAIGEIHIDMEVQDIYKLKTSLENRHSNIDGLVKNLEIVMPDSIRHPERIEFTGFRLSPE